jgi:glucokinase
MTIMKTKLLLAGDIGGTKTSLGIYAPDADGRPRLQREASFASREHRDLDAILDVFLADGTSVDAAAFGIAGPVEDGVVQVTNLPWRIEAPHLAAKLGCRVRLLNDLEATAWATLALDPAEVVVLNEGVERPGTRCVIAAGTGLGQALLAWDGARYHVIATEGGHADFAPRDPTGIALLEFLLERYPRASWERVLSGAGLCNVFDFVVERLGIAPSASTTDRLVSADVAQVVGEQAVAGVCPASRRAVEIFVAAYGAQAGNLALTGMGVGGVYVAGGIAPKLLPLLQSGAFLEAFTAKQPFVELMRRIPVRVMTDANAPRNGAAAVAGSLLD